MDKRIVITRHEYGMTIADDRTGLRVEVFELPTGLSLEAYGYHSKAPRPVMTVTEANEERTHPAVEFVMPEAMPVTRTRQR